ncbi:site-2 protease family protein [Streptomyces sp. GDS52]|uniref:Site-2 protease family protein n=1 Tax=Streptomyces cathayae TaxID=3031124 RepID=A0ABY8K6J0_9ACTN|nr:site-2 protease family protein [Streptomyces sp. HUAS 5]WGD43879.1 site-2 protease family protein [Streptomyces sp. HUAS 5]
MDASGGGGQPRSGNDEPDERHMRATEGRPPTDGGRLDPPETAPSTPDDRTDDRDPSASGDAPSRTGGAPAETGEPSAPADTDGATPRNGEQPARPPAPDTDAHPQNPRSPDDGWSEPPAPAGAPSERAPRDDGHRSAPSEPHGTDRTLAHSGSGKGPAPRPPEQQRGGLLMGRPFGVPVYVAPSWFLVAILITWVFGGQIDRVLPELGAASYLVSLFFAVAFYASVLVHELAHTLAALRFKLPVRRIQLQFFGGVSEIEKEAETPGREFVLAFVGPLLSLVLSGLFYVALLAVEPSSVPGVLLAGLMISNLIVAVFNLLPGLPLDGGRMLRAVVWKLTGKPMSGTIAAAWVGRVLAVSVLIGLPLLTQSGALGSAAEDSVGMDTVLDALLAAILAAIIWTGAGNSLRMARLREHLPELRARALTRRAVPVETDTPLSEALRRANAAGARALVVVDPDGTPLSLVREAAIVGVPEHRRPWVPVSGLAQDLTDGMRVSAELAGEDLLEALRAAPATEYLVVETTGEIYGVLSAADVERAFVKAMARPA